MNDVVNPVVDVGVVKVFEDISLSSAKETVKTIHEEAEQIAIGEASKDIGGIFNMLDTVPASTYQYYVRLAQIKLNSLRK